MLLNALTILAADPKQGGTVQLIMMGAIILVFWLFMIRPQAKKAKEKKKKNLNKNFLKGEKIVTIAGIHGVVNKINEDGTLQLEVTPGSYLKIEKSALSMEWTAAINKPVAEEKK